MLSNGKLFALRIVAWRYICLLKIIIHYLKPYNYMQTNDLSHKNKNNLHTVK